MVYICPEIQALSNAVETMISGKYKPISECPNCFMHQQFVVYNQRHQNKFTVTRKQRERGKWLLVSFLLQCLINLSTPSPKNFELHVTTLHSQIVCISFCINLHKYFYSPVETIK